MTAALLSVRNLTVEFPTLEGPFTAVAGLDLEIEAGRTLAVVGESGSGKSVTSLAILRLTDYTGGRITNGQVMFTPRDGVAIDLARASEARLEAIRGNEIAMIFQEPMSSLNPVFTVGDQIAEAIVLHQDCSSADARKLAQALLEKVRMPDARTMLDRYPHQLSGGMRQRVVIAMALSCQPKLLIADEPTTALDVTIQAQILNTIRDLQQEFGTAVIFITHDMGVVAEMADDVAVMWRGRKIEQAPVRELFAQPAHEYTRALLAAVPRLGSMSGTKLPRRGSVAQDTADMTAPLIAAESLTTTFPIRQGLLRRVTRLVHAAERVSFDIFPGETLSLVGESGSGKTTIGRTLQQLIAPSSGIIRFKGQDVTRMDHNARRRLKREVSYVFQDPYGSLDPRKTVGFSVAEPILTHNLLPCRNISQRVAELLEQVGLLPEHARRYPHSFSGGQRQRICIARALACDPKLVIADEAVSALDVSVQAQIIDLLMQLQAQRGLAYLFISHDMAVVERISHRVAVLYLGQIVEIGTRAQVFEDPRHAYTRKLLAAVPVAEPGRPIDRRLVAGEIPSPIRRVGDPPVANNFDEVAPGHLVAR